MVAGEQVGESLAASPCTIAAAVNDAQYVAEVLVRVGGQDRVRALGGSLANEFRQRDAGYRSRALQPLFELGVQSE